MPDDGADDPGSPAPGREPEHGFAAIEDLASIKALMHPLRMRAYVEAVKGPVSAKDLSVLFDVPLQRISYHVRALADAGMLRVVSRTPRRGAMETHYRAVATLDVSSEAIARGGPEAEAMWAQVLLRLLTEDALHAVEREQAAAEDFVLARAHLVVDAAGRERLREELRAMYERLSELEAELRVEPGEDAHEFSVVLVSHLGRRAGGRNGPLLLLPGADELETIPPE